MNERCIYVVTGDPGTGSASIARALLRGVTQSANVVTLDHYARLQPFTLGAVLAAAPAALLIEAVPRSTVEELEALAFPFRHPTIPSERMGREPVLVATPVVALLTRSINGTLRGHPYLKEVRAC